MLFSFVEGDGVPVMAELLYQFSYEDIVGTFGKSGEGFLLRIEPQDEGKLEMWCNRDGRQVMIGGNMSAMLLRFAMWIGLGLMVAPYDTVAVHGSCIVHEGKAVLFLGESGTGVLQAYGAIHPSCPPQFAYDGDLYDHVSGFIDKLLGSVVFYHLECLPDGDAARLAFQTTL